MESMSVVCVEINQKLCGIDENFSVEGIQNGIGGAEAANIQLVQKMSKM